MKVLKLYVFGLLLLLVKNVWLNLKIGSKNEFGIECQYLEEVTTFPDRDENGNVVEDTGGRNDVFFAIKNDDNVPKFAIKRFEYGIRWAEDAVPQYKEIYPEHVLEYI